MGQSLTQRSKNSGCGTLVTGPAQLSGWNLGQDQMRHVGLVFARSPLGVLRTQPSLVGNCCRLRRRPRRQHGLPCQCQTPKSTPGSVTGRGHAGPRRIAIQGPVLGFLNRGVRDSARRSENALLEWKSQSLYQAETDFVFPSLRRNGKKPLDLAAVLSRKIKPAFVKLGISGVGWHTFRHSVGSILAGMGEHQLTIHDYLRHSHLNVTNQILAGDFEHQASRPREAGRRDPAHGVLVREQINSGSVNPAKRVGTRRLELLTSTVSR